MRLRKPIKTEADLIEAIDHGITDWLGKGDKVVSYEGTWNPSQPIAAGTIIKITGYNTHDKDIVSFRFGGDRK